MKHRTIKHYDDQQEVHTLTFTCFHSLPLLSKERTCLWFVHAIKQARLKHSFDLWAWVAMPTHAHLLIYPKAPQTSTSKVLQSIRSSVGKRAIDYLRKMKSPFLEKLKVITGRKIEYHFWQDGPGHDRNLREPQAIHEEIRYLHENSMKAGLVDRIEDWRWSSASAWAGDPQPVRVIDRESVPRVVL
jgi:putative transposase